MERNHLTYTPQGPTVHGKHALFQTTRLMFQELASAKELIIRLIIRDFSSRYRQSLLGFSWAFIMPLITVSVFIFMNRAGILQIPDVGIPYPLYSLIGLSIWNLFTIGVTAGTNSIVSAGSMVVKINFPKAALVIAASLNGLIEFIIHLVLIFLAFLYFRITPDGIGSVIGIVSLLPLYLLMLGTGFLLSLTAVVIRDVQNILHLALSGLMLLTPILYPISGSSFLARVNRWNPFNYLVNTPRDFIILGSSSTLQEYFLTALVSVAIFYVGWRLFYLAQTKIAERL